MLALGRPGDLGGMRDGLETDNVGTFSTAVSISSAQ